MNGQTISYKEKMNIAEEFISRINPYEEREPLQFDLRGYAEYLEKNNLSGRKVPDSVIDKFKK